MRPDLSFQQLTRLSEPLGLYEHALGTAPRPEHGFCVDDVARALVVTSRVPDPSAEVVSLRAGYLDFVRAAQRDDGLMHNRRGTDGSWNDRPSSNDHWGRGLWALGTTAAEVEDADVAECARLAASIALRSRSIWPRSMAYAALGAGQLLRAVPGDSAALRLLCDARRVLDRSRPDARWPWPEDRLTYANAVLPEAMIVIGGELADESLRDDGLLLLDWLVEEQTVDGHLSLVPSTGWSRHDCHPGYAQQPIEAAALAEACRTAYLATSHPRWVDAIEMCLDWFAGANDEGLVMCDVATGGGFDGLERGHASTNQGAESTLAWLSTLQVAAMPLLTVSR
jgi:hypothetical protein